MGVLSSFVVLQVLLTAGAVTARLLKHAGRFSDQIRLNYRLLQAALAAYVLHFFFPRPQVFKPLVHVWAASSERAFRVAPAEGVKSAATVFVPAPVRADDILYFFGGLLIGVAVVAIGFALRDGFRLRALVQRSFRLRAIGHVRVCVSEDAAGPIAFRSFTRAYVVLPMELLSRPGEFKLSLQHELQHHRQGDTGWVYVLFTVKCLSFFNPLVRAWMEWIGETQELACDEALLGRGRAEPQEYARCLIQAAQTALESARQPVCATGLLFGNRRQLLSRRIKHMFENQKPSLNRMVLPALTAGALLVFCMSAFAARGWIQDRRVSVTQAQQMARVSEKGSGFPIVVNEDVVRQLNLYIGTPEGRDFIRAGLRRMQDHKAVVEKYIHDYDMPTELMAVPLIESGYQNLEQKPEHGGAGLWMFIRSTARVFGLRVDKSVDERLNIPLESDAAMRYLASNHLRFRDWQLALLAYNIGEKRLQECIEETGSRDAWHLIHHGCEGDSDYLAKVMAAVLIINKPSSVN